MKLKTPAEFILNVFLTGKTSGMAVVDCDCTTVPGKQDPLAKSWMVMVPPALEVAPFKVAEAVILLPTVVEVVDSVSVRTGKFFAKTAFRERIPGRMTSRMISGLSRSFHCLFNSYQESFSK